ncbi:MAG: RrF2 family transcriptional regulator [Thermoleophilia bacterium]
MQLTRQADYAIRALLRLSEAEFGTVIQTKEIASTEAIPEKYLPTIMRTLARAGLVRTLRGNQGGVLLARQPSEINLREVIEAIEEPIMLNRCLREDGECNREGSCPVHPVWDRIQKTLIDKLESTTFADLATERETTVGTRSSKGWQMDAGSQRVSIPA